MYLSSFHDDISGLLFGPKIRINFDKSYSNFGQECLILFFRFKHVYRSSQENRVRGKKNTLHNHRSSKKEMQEIKGKWKREKEEAKKLQKNQRRGRREGVGWGQASSHCFLTIRAADRKTERENRAKRKTNGGRLQHYSHQEKGEGGGG